MENASLECIRQLLEIIEAERNHELLLSVKNLWELGISLFRFIFPVIPRQLSTELIKGEHFVLAACAGISLQTGSVQAEVAEGALVKFVRPDQLPLAEQDPQLSPKRRRRRKQRRVDIPRLLTRD